MPDQHRDTAETAWLVESGPTRAPMYLRVWEARWVWTLDPFKAFRCAREHDAIALAKCHAGTDHMPPALRAVEHSFVLDDGAV